MPPMDRPNRKLLFGDEVCHLGDAFDLHFIKPNFEDLFALAKTHPVEYGDPGVPDLVHYFNRATRMEYQTRAKEISSGVPACLECLDKTFRQQQDRSPQATHPDILSAPGTFKYDALPNTGSLRILELQASPTHEAPLRGILKTHSSKNTATYFALSYTWAGIEASDSFDLTTGILPITGNLGLALRALRKQDSVLHIWIDAVCINQQDTAEKSVQVAQMGDIYKNAEVVLAWLGSETKHTSAATEYLEELAALSETEKYDSHVRPLALPAMDKLYFPMEIDEAVRICRMQQSKHLDDIYGRTWFTRLWVVQEVLLAKQITLNIGHYQIDFERFRRATRLHNAAESLIQGTSFSSSPFWPAFALVAYRDQLQQVNSGRVMFHDYTMQAYGNVTTFRMWGCKDPLDRVYAMLSLIPSGSNMVLQPNYEAQAEGVYTEFARQHLLREGLSVLTLAGLDRRYDPSSTAGVSGIIAEKARDRKGLESVDTDLGTRPFLPSWAPEPRSEKARGVRNWTPLHFIAGMSWSPALVLHTKCPHLVAVKGFLFDRLEQPLPPEITRDKDKTGPMDVDEVLKYIFFVWRFASERYEKEGGYPTREDYDVVSKSVFTAGGTLGEMKLSGSRPSQLKDDGFDRTWEALKHCFAAAGGRNIEEAVESLASVRLGLNDLLSHNANLLETNHFVITENGLMGFLPSITRAGDKIGIIYRLACPVVLRPTPFEDQFQLMGPCFLHGVMKGELNEVPEHAASAKFMELV